ncbi:hypothetical protein LWI29_018762 [Acer saccharum]|uniref:Uncharacterized protein n=1 Tax=Acer saccharum TaxID=4024 RepID=A0AA39RDL3_ACESA|nr:hypothetical protein LWI29_018762 [Acer saccharum]
MKKRSHPDKESLEEGLVIKFPSNVSVYSDPGSMLKQALQTHLFLRKDLRNLSKKVTSLTFSNAKIKKELEEARCAEAGAKEAMKGAVDKLAGLKRENASLQASLKSSEDKLSQTDKMLTDALERLDKAVDEAVIETRGKLMQEYLLGHTDTWDPEKEIKVWDQWKELKALKIDDEGDGEEEEAALEPRKGNEVEGLTGDNIKEAHHEDRT